MKAFCWVLIIIGWSMFFVAGFTDSWGFILLGFALVFWGVLIRAIETNFDEMESMLSLKEPK